MLMGKVSEQSNELGERCKLQSAKCSCGFGDLQAGVGFALAGLELARACMLFHGSWKHQLQFSIVTQQGKRGKPQTV